MDEKIKQGDVVELISGGLLMTVEAVDEVTEQVYCCWFDTKSELKKAQFNIRAVRKVQD